MCAKVIKVFGPPGTGKTTTLSRIIEEKVQQYGGDKVFVSSFTRAAAHELTKRGLPVPPENIGTLHAMCYRMFERPKIAETFIADFAQLHPEYGLTPGGSIDPDDPNAGLVDNTFGNVLMSQYNILRARMTHRDKWPHDVLRFAKDWEAWCFKNNYIDFTAMIEKALREETAPPGLPDCGFFDEAQDFTALEMELVRKWSEWMHEVYIVGDDDQCIYSFKGGDPNAFLDFVGEQTSNEFLRKSYRLPSKIVNIATRWIEQVERRQKKGFAPREDGGHIEYIPMSFKQPDQLLNVARQHIKEGRTVMFLSSCAYQLDPLKGELFRQGIPWHNPYRKRRGDWNPLVRKRLKAKTSFGRLMDYFMLNDEDPEIRRLSGGMPMDYANFPLWSDMEFLSWIELCQARKLFNISKAKEKFKDFMARWHNNTGGQLTITNNPVKQFCYNYMQEEALYNITTDLCFGMTKINAIEGLLLAAKRKALEFPIGLFGNGGINALSDEPRVLIGTIHSVKGGEADVVFLCPDLSPSSMQDYIMPGPGRDAIIRQFYVGMTRTKEVLYMCGSSTPNSVGWI